MNRPIVALLSGLLFVATASAAPAPGARVLAQWGDGLWYPAKVASAEGGRISVNFDDGDVAAVGPAQVKPLDWQAGTRVECNWHNQGRYYPGKIAAITAETLQIHYDDGGNETATVARCRSR